MATTKSTTSRKLAATRRRSTTKDAATTKVQAPKTRALPEGTDRVLEVIRKAGRGGITLAEIVEKTGIPYRKVHNITWRLEGGPKEGELRHPEDRKARRVNGSERTVRYAAGTDPAFDMRGVYATRAPDPQSDGKTGKTAKSAGK